MDVRPKPATIFPTSPCPLLLLSPFSLLHHLPPAVGSTYPALQLAVYALDPTTVGLAPTANVALVTTLSTTHVLHGTCVVTPLAGPTSTAVVSAHAPDQTVGPGMMYSVAQGVVDVFAFLVSVEQ
jgi:hypothetical protein